VTAREAGLHRLGFLGSSAHRITPNISLPGCCRHVCTRRGHSLPPPFPAPTHPHRPPICQLTLTTHTAAHPATHHPHPTCSAFCQGGVTFYLPSDSVCKQTFPPVFGEIAPAAPAAVALHALHPGAGRRFHVYPCVEIHVWTHTEIVLEHPEPRWTCPRVPLALPPQSPMPIPCTEPDDHCEQADNVCLTGRWGKPAASICRAWTGSFAPTPHLCPVRPVPERPSSLSASAPRQEVLPRRLRVPLSRRLLVPHFPRRAQPVRQGPSAAHLLHRLG
jgi:hypothetical protein